MSNHGDRRRIRERRESAARKYLPERIDLLLVAEAPPVADDRYFYFEDVRTNDWLFRGVTEALLGQNASGANKASALAELKNCGVLLIDLKLDPVDGSDLKLYVDDLVTRCVALKPCRIVLIKATVFDAAYEALSDAGLPVVNKRVFFPASGQQNNFRKQFAEALMELPNMRGKTTFTHREAGVIRKKLGEVRRADRDVQKKLRNELRKMGFYIRDFTSSNSGFTAADFDALVQRGTLSIV